MVEGSDRLADGIEVQTAPAGAPAVFARLRRRRPGPVMSEPQTTGNVPEEDPRLIATGSTLADISIRNHVFAWMLMASLVGFGLICFTGFGGIVAASG